MLNGETPGSTKEINQSIAALKSNLRVQEIGPAFTQAVGPDVDYAMYEQPLAKFREVVLHVKSLKAVMFSDLAFGAFNDEGLIIPVISKWNAQVSDLWVSVGWCQHCICLMHCLLIDVIVAMLCNSLLILCVFIGTIVTRNVKAGTITPALLLVPLLTNALRGRGTAMLKRKVR